MTDNITYKATGIVYGNYWGGGGGTYSAKPLEAATKEDLIEVANKKLNDGSLDSGMGYESLKGALLEITKVTTKIIDGKEFTNKETETEFIGNLTDEESEFVEDVYYSL